MIGRMRTVRSTYCARRRPRSEIPCVSVDRNNIPLSATGGVCVSLFVAGGCAYPYFASVDNVVNCDRHAYVGVVAVGMTFVILRAASTFLLAQSSGDRRCDRLGRRKHDIHPAVAIRRHLPSGRCSGRRWED